MGVCIGCGRWWPPDPETGYDDDGPCGICEIEDEAMELELWLRARPATEEEVMEAPWGHEEEFVLDEEPERRAA